MRVIEGEFLRLGSERLALLDDSLRQRVPEAVQVSVLDVLPAAIRAGMDVFIRERVLQQQKCVVAVFKVRVRLEVEPGQLPEPVVVLVQDFAALTQIDPQLLVNFLVEVLQQLLPGLGLGL